MQGTGCNWCDDDWSDSEGIFEQRIEGSRNRVTRIFAGKVFPGASAATATFNASYAQEQK